MPYSLSAACYGVEMPLTAFAAVYMHARTVYSWPAVVALSDLCKEIKTVVLSLHPKFHGPQMSN